MSPRVSPTVYDPAIVLARPFQSIVYTFIKEDDIYIFDDDFHTFLFLTPEFYQ